jgi:hypothetical protein
MKVAALVVMVIGLLLAVYDSAVIAPDYAKQYQASKAPDAKIDAAKLQAVRDAARTYAYMALGAAIVALALGGATSKKDGPPYATIVAGSVITIFLVVYMQLNASVL